MRIVKSAHRVAALLIAAMFAASVSAQSFVYPAKGQSPQQQKKDEGECHTGAVDQSKYDPTKPPQQTAAAKPPRRVTLTALTGPGLSRAV